MKIVADENIAFAAEAFSKFGDVILLNGRDISRNEIKTADVLIVRSITRVDLTLLNGTSVKFVGTATIGTDHIDLEYLNKNNICFADAKGCNADSVAEYVINALINIAFRKSISLKGKTIGVIGVGNIGSRVVKYAEALGLKVLKNDPPKQRFEKKNDYVSLEKALKADIVTLHVPLNREGVDKTFHLLDERNLSGLNENVILINTSRGEVIDNQALLKKAQEKHLNLILDVWENEPSINTELLKHSLIGTAHIAGYSLEGKVNGTRMIFDALCKFTGKNEIWKPNLPDIPNKILYTVDASNPEKTLYLLFNSVYKIEEDNAKMRKMIKINKNRRAEYFDLLRKEYNYRREFSNFTAALNEKNKNLAELLKTLRFKVKHLN